MATKGTETSSGPFSDRRLPECRFALKLSQAQCSVGRSVKKPNLRESQRVPVPAILSRRRVCRHPELAWS